MSQFKEVFVSEATDHLDLLNEAILILEKVPEDKENINRIFRSFHTLKGSSATLGFTKFSELAHALEGVMQFPALLPFGDFLPHNAERGML